MTNPFRQLKHENPLPLFNERKATEAAAFFLLKARGSLDLLKLMKLLYLAERESFKRFGESITNDSFVSMRHGPVLSIVLDLINGFYDGSTGHWSKWISDRANHKISINKKYSALDPEEDLLGLSDSDVECLSAVWEEFGGMNTFDLVEYTHTHCPEWENPGSSSLSISVPKMLQALGYTEEAIASIQELTQERLSLHNLMHV